MDEVLFPKEGRGKEICDFLKRELNIPKRAISFEVRFHHKEAITVRCEYYPEVNDAAASIPSP